MFEHFKDQMGQFTASANDTELQTRSFFNLFRASLIAFPEEKVLEEARKLAAAYLKAALQTLPVSGLSRELRQQYLYSHICLFTSYNLCFYLNSSHHDCFNLSYNFNIVVSDTIRFRLSLALKFAWTGS